MLKERYLSAEKCTALTAHWSSFCASSIAGYSFENRPIYQFQWGNGPIRVLLWSQMHGNESTTTRALLQLFTDLEHDLGELLQDHITLYVIPQLNPDGATAYTRHNAQDIDLNRDAQQLKAPESRVLRQLANTFAPHWCFNLHDQRTVHAAGVMGPPATLSFLAPAADVAKTRTPSRLKAMALIASIHQALNSDLKGGIGRYDDTFNPNCVGDYFATQHIPTVLFEAGHYPNDYERNTTTKFVYKALIVALKGIATAAYTPGHAAYFKIPENAPSYCDVLVQHLTIENNGKVSKNQMLAVQLEEQRKGAVIELIPSLSAFGKALTVKGHRVLKLKKEEQITLQVELKDSLQIKEKLIELLGKNNI